MHKKCPKCRLVNFAQADICERCGSSLPHAARGHGRRTRPRIIVRSLICLCVCVGVILCFYISLLASANSLGIEQKSQAREAVRLLRERGFADEAFLLENVAVFRADDNWLNASVAKENAYAATNFPFAIITLYPDFFTYPADATERAAILLHEAKHITGSDEHQAYEFVWKHRAQLGWTREHYAGSAVWQNVRRQTREDAPNLFVCEDLELDDCTETPFSF